jgi:hypothetical protein
MFISKLTNCLMCWSPWFAGYVHTTNTFIRQIFKCLIWYTVHLLYAEFRPVTAQLGHAVAHLVEALRYKPEGRGFDSRCCHWNFSLT